MDRRGRQAGMMAETRNSLRQRVSLVVAAAVLAAAAGAAHAGSLGLRIHLNAQATVRAAQVTLGDVADLSGPQAGAFAGLVVGRLDQVGDHTCIKLSDIGPQLVAQGANQAFLTLAGYAQCRVTRVVAPAPVGVPAAGTAQANPEGVVEISGASAGGAAPAPAALGPVTLRELVLRKIEQIAGMSRAHLQITFSPADEQALSAAAGADAIEIRPQTNVVPGRVPMVIRRIGATSVSRPIWVTADVARTVEAAVATRQICRGEIFTQDAVALKQVALNTPGTPVTDMASLIGQVCRSTIAPGTVILSDIVQPPLLIKRGELVTVRCVAGNLVVTTVARAQQDGAMGEVIRATNEKSRESFEMRVTGPRQGLMLAGTGK